MFRNCFYLFGGSRGVSASVCKCAVCVFGQTCTHMNMHACWSLEVNQVCSLIILHCIYWSRHSLWTWNLPFWVVWLGNLLLGFPICASHMLGLLRDYQVQGAFYGGSENMNSRPHTYWRSLVHCEVFASLILARKSLASLPFWGDIGR